MRINKTLIKIQELASKLHSAANRAELIKTSLDDIIENSGKEWNQTEQGKRMQERADALQKISLELDDIADKLEDL